MTKMTTLPVEKCLPRDVQDRLDNAQAELILDTLTAVINEQQELLKKLQREQKPGEYRRRRPRRYQNEFSKRFGAIISHVPKTIRETAKKIRDTEGYEKACDFIQEWRKNKLA